MKKNYQIPSLSFYSMRYGQLLAASELEEVAGVAEGYDDLEEFIW